MASLFFCGSFVLLAQPADFAASVDEAAARRIAIEFVGRNLPGSVLKSDRGEGLTTAYVSKGEEGENCFYVFNIGQDKGFVIVSGDSRAPAVLGYAEKGSFHYDEAPENMKWWLSEYARQIGQISGDLVVGVREGLKTSKESGVLPLLDDIAYNQDEPFNKFCPVLPDGTTAPTGCVATAVAQIMRYYGHPLTGTGSHSYTWENANGETQVLSADFGATQYDWDNMLPSYEDGYNDDQAEAVATLMYHLGVAFEMDYAPVSLVSSSSVPPALHGFFGYDGAMSYRSRSNYSDEDWKALIRAELEAGRPVYYGGQADGGGHAFVLDGYQADDYFHVNWGWSGRYDGYFLLDALNPEGQGTGGFEGGYNRYQDMLIGIQPEAGGVFQPVIYSLGISAVDDSVLRDGGRIRLSGIFSNWDWDTARAEIGMLLYDESEELVDTLGLSGQVLFTPYGGGFGFDKEHPFEDMARRDMWYTLVYFDGEAVRSEHVESGRRKVSVRVDSGGLRPFAMIPLGTLGPIGGFYEGDGHVMLRAEDGSFAEMLIRAAGYRPDAVSRLSVEALREVQPHLADIDEPAFLEDLYDGTLSPSSIESAESRPLMFDLIPSGYWLSERYDDHLHI